MAEKTKQSPKPKTPDVSKIKDPETYIVLPAGAGRNIGGYVKAKEGDELVLSQKTTRAMVLARYIQDKTSYMAQKKEDEEKAKSPPNTSEQVPTNTPSVKPPVTKPTAPTTREVKPPETS
jgi:hypothetical protein